MAFERKFEDAKEFSDNVDAYFMATPVEELGRAGLCVFLGISKETLNKLSKQPNFDEVVRMALTRIEKKYEVDLTAKGRASEVFALKQYGWADKSEAEIKGTGSIEIITNIPRPSED